MFRRDKFIISETISFTHCWCLKMDAVLSERCFRIAQNKGSVPFVKVPKTSNRNGVFFKIYFTLKISAFLPELQNNVSKIILLKHENWRSVAFAFKAFNFLLYFILPILSLLLNRKYILTCCSLF